MTVKRMDKRRHHGILIGLAEEIGKPAGVLKR
jgi:hypothetical protein